jgi:hypothetical protein
MFSLFGWTPSLRRMLQGKVLGCGCSVGVYETWSGDVVQIVDAHASDCQSSAHAVDAVVPIGGFDDDRRADPGAPVSGPSGP